MERHAAAFHVGLNNYVPAMQYASDLLHGQPSPFSLGTPAAADDDIIAATIDADAVAGVEEAYPYTIDATYGRTLQLKISADPGAASSVIDVYGWDYLRQPMIERFTTANGSTAILYGKKAFKYIQKTKIVTAATNAVTAKLGTYTRLGLPYKGDPAWAKESGVLVQVYKRDVIEWIDRAAAKAVAGGTDFIRASFPGFVKTLYGVPAGGGGATDPVITVELGGTAIIGLTVTIDTSDVAGLEVSDVPTTVGYNANNRFVTGGKIELVAAAAAGAFADRLGLELTPTQFTHPDTTDAATVTTGDPRGTYDPLTPPNGGEIIVALIGDVSVNTSSNGGLHGIRHYYA